MHLSPHPHPPKKVVSIGDQSKHEEHIETYRKLPSKSFFPFAEDQLVSSSAVIVQVKKGIENSR